MHDDVARIDGVFGNCHGMPLRGFPRENPCVCMPNKPTFGNTLLSGTATCPEGLCGTPVPYVVEAGKYFAPTQEEADTLARETAIFYALNGGHCHAC